MAPRSFPIRPTLWWVGLGLMGPALASEPETAAGALARQPPPWIGVQAGVPAEGLRLSVHPGPGDDSALVPVPWVVPHWVARRVALGADENSVQLHCQAFDRSACAVKFRWLWRFQ